MLVSAPARPDGVRSAEQPTRRSLTGPCGPLPRMLCTSAQDVAHVRPRCYARAPSLAFRGQTEVAWYLTEAGSPQRQAEWRFKHPVGATAFAPGADIQIEMDISVAGANAYVARPAFSNSSMRCCAAPCAAVLPACVLWLKHARQPLCSKAVESAVSGAPSLPNHPWPELPRPCAACRFG